VAGSRASIWWARSRLWAIRSATIPLLTSRIRGWLLAVGLLAQLPMREIVIDRASLVFRDEVLIEAKLKGNRTSKSFFAVFPDRLIMVMVADTIHYFLGAIARRLWFIIEPMSTRAAPI
jgi:hypothetical protein